MLMLASVTTFANTKETKTIKIELPKTEVTKVNVVSCTGTNSDGDRITIQCSCTGSECYQKLKKLLAVE